MAWEREICASRKFEAREYIIILEHLGLNENTTFIFPANAMNAKFENLIPSSRYFVHISVRHVDSSVMPEYSSVETQTLPPNGKNTIREDQLSLLHGKTRALKPESV